MPESANVLPPVPATKWSPQRLPEAAALSTQDPSVDAGLKNACEEMEALFLHYLLSEMRKSIPKSGLIDGGHAEEIYTSRMDAELAKQMAHSGGMGLSRMLLEQMSAVSSGPKGYPVRR